MGFFASFVLDRGIVQQIMNWDMAIIQESPWYKQIEVESELCGELRGELRSIRATLKVKFGDVGLQLMPQISEISDLERLSAIFLHILTSNTLEEVQNFLQQ